MPILTGHTQKVRRLTVLECERLQGLPDNWTNVEFKGKPASDAKRYKAIGNGMAQPCADFVMQRVVEAIRNSKENNHMKKKAPDAVDPYGCLEYAYGEDD